MMRLPCIVCEKGDPYSNIVCDDCTCSIELRQETYESMVSLVLDLNNLKGAVSINLSNEVHEKVKSVYDLLIEIKIKE